MCIHSGVYVGQMNPNNLAERVEMAPNAVTTGHCQIHLRPGGAEAHFLFIDPGQRPGWGCGDEAPESPRVPAFYNTQK